MMINIGFDDEEYEERAGHLMMCGEVSQTNKDLNELLCIYIRMPVCISFD